MSEAFRESKGAWGSRIRRKSFQASRFRVGLVFAATYCSWSCASCSLVRADFSAEPDVLIVFFSGTNLRLLRKLLLARQACGRGIPHVQLGKKADFEAVLKLLNASGLLERIFCALA